MAAQAPTPPSSQRISAAGRLLLLLQPVINAGGQDPIYGVLARAVERSPGDREAGLDALASVHRLVRLAKAEVAVHPELKQELYTNALASVDTIFASANPLSPWSTVQAQLQQAILALEFCADQMNRLSDEPFVSQDVLKGLLTEIETLQKDVLTADLEPVLKNLVIRKLDELRTAILRYGLDGAAGLARAVESTVGAVVVANEPIRKAGKIKQLTDLLELVVKIDTVLQTVGKYAPLAAPLVRRLLGAGEPGAG